MCPQHLRTHKKSFSKLKVPTFHLPVCHAGAPVKDLWQHAVMLHCGVHNFLLQPPPNERQADVQRAAQRHAAAALLLILQQHGAFAGHLRTACPC